MAHGADMVVESRNMSDDVLFSPELIVLMTPTIYLLTEGVVCTRLGDELSVRFGGTPQRRGLQW